QNGTVVNLRMSTRFCTKGDGFQFLAKFAILPQNANSPFCYRHGVNAIPFYYFPGNLVISNPGHD
ncbi:hypothetical protein ACY15D_20060, partial [Klebsiella pneumoniae]